ncbi:MAG: hypothetical protein HC904_12910 [Blastochloris sp.]|nr:hypothetical protein [Blastochloris sp.]
MSDGMELAALRAFDQKAWDQVYPALYQIAYASCFPTLNATDREDVANQSLHELLNYLEKFLRSMN